MTNWVLSRDGTGRPFRLGVSTATGSDTLAAASRRGETVPDWQGTPGGRPRLPVSAARRQSRGESSVSTAGRGRDERGVAVTLNYVLVIAISTTLVTGLLLAGGSFVEDQREQVIRSELSVIGNHMASNLEQVDRFAAAGGDPEAAYINQSLQRSVTGSSYTVRLTRNPDQVVLASTRPGVVVRVNVSVSESLDTDSFATGGEMSTYYDPDGSGDGKLVVDDV